MDRGAMETEFSVSVLRCEFTVGRNRFPVACAQRTAVAQVYMQVPEKQESLRGGSAAQRACCSFRRAKFNS